MNDVRIPRPAPRDEFRKRLRADLMNEAVALAEERRLRPASFGARLLTLVTVRLRPVVVAATLVAVLLGGAGVAAAGSVSGDPAFALKRAAEEVELALAPGEDAKVEVLTTQAERRLDEFARASGRAEKAPTASAEYEAAVKRLAAAVEALRAAPAGEKREAVEQVVDAARDKHVRILEELKQRLPAEAKRGIERAIEEHGRIVPGKPGERSPKKDDHRPGGAPARPEASASPHQTERPRASETPRGGRPTIPAPATPRR